VAAELSVHCCRLLWQCCSGSLSRMAKSGLGKGLGALISGRPALAPTAVDSEERIREVALTRIVPSPLQPRKDFSEEALTELVDSIRQHGIIQLRQEDIASKVGRSRAAVANALRLLDLHPQIQVWLTQDLLSVGHAKVLLGLKGAEEQLAVAQTVLRRSATVRATERLVARQLGGVRSRRRRRSIETTAGSAAIEDLQERLQQHLGTRVTVHHGEKRGRIEIEYYGNDDLQRVVTALGLEQSVS